MTAEQLKPSCVLTGKCPGGYLRSEPRPETTAWNERMKVLCATDFPLVARFVAEEAQPDSCGVMLSNSIVSADNPESWAASVVDQLCDEAATRHAEHIKEQGPDTRVEVSTSAGPSRSWSK
jgi:hypothetical protein